jgi:hypothetical protein
MRLYRHWSPGEFTAFLAVLAVVAGARAWYLHRRARATLRWRPVDGKITWSMVDEKQYPTRWGSDRTVYKADIKYSYTIGEHEHQGTRVYFGVEGYSRRFNTARDLVDQFPPGKVVRVFVDPARLQETVLLRGQEQIARRVMLIAIGLVTASVVLYGLRANLGWLY